LVLVSDAEDYIPYNRRHELADPASEFHLKDPAGSPDFAGRRQVDFTSDRTVVFVWLAAGPKQSRRRKYPAATYFVLRYEYKIANRQWEKVLKVYPRFEQDPVWGDWDEWEMTRNGWHQLEQIEARDEL